MREGTIRFKVVIIFSLAFATVIVAGWLSWKSLQEILTNVDQLARPDKKRELLNEINTNIGRLNYLYRTYSTSPSVPDIGQQHSIIISTKQKLDSIKYIGFLTKADELSIDSIYNLLDEIEVGTTNLFNYRKIGTQKSIASNLIQKLSFQLEDYKGTDSTFVIVSTTKEVRVSDFTLKTLDSLTRAGVIKEKPGFLKKLITRSSKKNKAIPQDTIVILPEKQIDTLTRTFVDSVNVISNDDMIDSLRIFLEKLYKDEIISIQYHHALENSINSKNALLLNAIDHLIARIEKQGNFEALHTSNNAYSAFGKFTRILSISIPFFTVAILLLLYLLFQDIKKTRRYQQQLMLEKEKSEREARMRKDFLAMMSHEIRTPLTSIVGYSDLMDESNEYGQAIKKSSEHMLNIANEILDLAKIETGVIEIHPGPVDLISVLKDLELSFKVQIEQKGLQGFFNLPAVPALWVKTDVYRLNQVLYNIVHNAIKYTDHGQVEVSLNILWETEKEIEVEFLICDTGIGISAADHERIFEKYQQVGPPSHKINGIGLGLGIVKKVTGMLGGTINVQSEHGHGSVFSATLLLPKAEIHERNKNTQARSGLLKGYKILAVDDDPLIVRLYSIILSDLGAEVTCYINPLEVLAEKTLPVYDLAIIDVQMPKMTGEELYDALQRAGKKPGKVIIATANVLLNSTEKKVLSRFDTVFYKPIRKRELIEKVAEVLDIPADTIPVVFPETEKKNSIELPYNLSDLIKLTMNDKALLDDVLKQLYRENDIEIDNAYALIATENLKELSVLIHRIASRFQQIKANEKNELLYKIEQRFRASSGISKNEIIELLDYWKNINEKIRSDLF